MELSTEGSRTTVTPRLHARRDAIDCFYVYPTVNRSFTPGNPVAFDDLEPMRRAATRQVAGLHQTCRVFAPLYRQMTIGSYTLPEAERQKHVAVAAADVLAAFDHYMAHENGGRPIVLIGHSQGGEMLIEVLRQRFDGNSRLRRKLAVAVLAGIPVDAPAGKAVGGTFKRVAVCRRPLQRSCVVAFKSHTAGSTAVQPDSRIPLPEGHDEVCVNPASLDIAGASATTPTRLRGSIIPPASWVGRQVRDDNAAELTVVRDVFSAACATGADPRTRYLAIRDETAVGDPRHGIVPLRAPAVSGALGLHTLDMQFPAEELVDLVRRRAPR